MGHKFGWVPDLPDHRDIRFAAPPMLTLPDKVDLRPLCPPVLDQRALSSCTANAIASAHEFNQKKQGRDPSFTPSRLFTYWNARANERTINSDAGCMIRSGMKSIVRLGVCPESEWDYNESRWAERPPAAAYTSALNHQALVYRKVQPTVPDMRACLAAGFPFVFGFTVFESLESEEVARTGVLPMPNGAEQMLGGHAVLAVGYNHAKKIILVQNSWGPNWGYKGYFTMPYGYLTHPDLAADFWMISEVE